MKKYIGIVLVLSFMLGMSSCKKSRFEKSSNAKNTKHKHLWQFHGGR